jgi:TolB-like protein
MTVPLDILKKALRESYDIQDELGEGGMATVYLATDLKHGRQVALKVLKPEVGASLGTERFLREIEIAANLSHPHILPLFDSGEADGLFYLVMPYVEGETLRDRLDREGPLPLDRAVIIASEIADALAYAHDCGLVHRDIKPENILFRSGHAAVSDFGIAVPAAGSERTRLTRTGVAVGTPAYMSPEQAAGERDVDARTDIYALGCILFEMLEGRPPFTGPTPQAVLARKLTGGRPEFTRSEEPPETVRAVLDRALSPEPDDRHGDARQFATELQTAATATEIEAARDRRRRRRSLRALAGLMTVVGLAVAGTLASRVLARPQIQRVAILPFENEVSDPQQASLLAGIHAALIGEMQQAGLQVIGRRSVIRYLGDTTPIEMIARELGVDAVLEGRAEYGQDSVRINLTMMDGRTETARWSGSFVSGAQAVISLYREATREIADEIRVELSPDAEARLAAESDVDPQSYELVLRGDYHWSRLTPQDLEVAQGLYERALDIDSDNALAMGGLARVWAGRQQFGLVSPIEARPLVRDYLRRALDAAPDEPRLVALHAMVLTWIEWDWEAGRHEFERATELNPNDWEARAYYSQLLSFIGDTAEARRQSELAREGDPFSGLVLGVACGTLHMIGDYEAAIEESREALRVDPTQPVAHDVITYSLRALGRMEEAVRQEVGLFTALGDTILANALSTGLEEGGAREASARAAAIMESRAEAGFIAPIRIALAHVYAGDIDRALYWLEQAEAIGDPGMPSIGVRAMPREIVARPRFQAILDRMGL